MKLSNRNISGLVTVILLFVVIGSFTWEILERIVALAGADIAIGTGRYGFDLGVIAIYLSPNPGSVLGAGAGILAFQRL